MARRKFRRSATPRRKVGAYKTRSRRRRMGATSLSMSGSSPIIQWGSALLGFFMPDLIPISTWVPTTVDKRLVAAGEAGIGFLLAQRKKKGRGMVATVITAGSWYMMGAGVKKGLQAFGVMTGIGPYGRVNVINGQSPYGRVNVINGGFSPHRALNGGFSPSRTINKVLTGVGDSSSGSGLTANVPGSGYMN